MAIDTRYRFYSADELEALRISTLTQLKTIEGVGQAHGISGRSHSAAEISKLTDMLGNIRAAQTYQASTADQGNKGCVRRFSNFNPNCGQ